MNDDDLKKLWQQQPLRVPDISAAQLVSAMQSKTSQLRRIVDARDLREVLASAFVIIIFGIFYFTIYNNPISRVGDLIVIGGAIFIAWKLVYTRRSHPPAPPGAATVESLRAELNSVRAQSRLLGSVLWWYLLPLAIGELIATWGLQIDLFSKSFGALIFIAVNAFIYRLNQRARAKQLLPVEAQLESLLHSAETGEPLDATQAASLRPIVVSMAAAGHVKPAEFKVAFWQIAIPGVAGFVGIWFFLMIGLGVYHENWKPKEPPFSPIPLRKQIATSSSFRRQLSCSTQAITPPCKSYTIREWLRRFRHRKIPRFIPTSQHVAARSKASTGPPPTAITAGPRSGCIASTMSWS